MDGVCASEGLDSWIGAGSWAAIHLRHHRGRSVAVKERKGNSPRHQQAHERELNVLSACKHENIVALCEVFSTIDMLGLALEFCQGGDLFRIIHPGGWVPSSSQKLKMLSDIAEAMGYLHGQDPQLIHRNLKSTNVLLTQPLDVGALVQAKVSGFGSSRMQEPREQHLDGAGPAMTKCVGTPNWMAPEVYTGIYDEKADVYSYAMVMFEILCLEVPFEDEDPAKIYHMTRRGARPDWANVPLSIPDVVADLMVGCWAHQPAGRPGFSTIREVIPARSL